VCGGDGAVDLVGAQGPGLDMIFADANAQKLMQTLKGTLRFEVTGLGGRTWALELMLGHAAEPRAVITVDADTYQQMQNRTLLPAQAYFSGKIVISGDVSLAMQAGMAMMSRMG
jgi:hypothetical protein